MATLRRSVIVSLLFIVFGGPGIGLVYVPLWITHFRIPAAEPWWQTLLAAALIAAGIAPALESMKRFIVSGRGTLLPTVPTEHLVVSGFYRHVRNPMYVGLVMALAGETVLFQSRALAILALLIALGFHLLVWLYEEPALTRRYGEEYLRYKSNVPRWLPHFAPWNGAV